MNIDDLPALQRHWFWTHVEFGPACWLWQGSIDRGGYGKYTIYHPDKRTMGAHQIAYLFIRGIIPDDLELDHLCRVRACVNPAHLEPVTHLENMGRTRPDKNKCRRGHPWSEENTYYWRNKRFCRICRRATRRASTERVALRLKAESLSLSSPCGLLNDLVDDEEPAAGGTEYEDDVVQDGRVARAAGRGDDVDRVPMNPDGERARGGDGADRPRQPVPALQSQQSGAQSTHEAT